MADRFTLGRLETDDHRNGHWVIIDQERPHIVARWGDWSGYDRELHETAKNFNDGTQNAEDYSWELAETGDYIRFDATV